MTRPHPLLRPLAARVPLRATAPLALQLDAAMRAALPAWLTQQAAAVQAIQAALASGADPAALDPQIRLLRDGLRQLGQAAQPLAGRVDAAFRSEHAEIMDARWLPAWLHASEMASLDRFNLHLDAYAQWAPLVLQPVQGIAQARIEDVAAGSGGFLRWLARHAQRRDLALTSSDVIPHYVTEGERLHRQQGPQALPITFAVRDATQLALRRGEVDLLVCTQATHHMPPWLVTVLLHQALRAAPCGVVVIDVLRSVGVAGSALLATRISSPSPLLSLDAAQSARRGFLPSELALYAHLAGATHIEAAALAPAYATLHARIG